MSAQTLAGVEAAILAHHRDTTDLDDKPERAGAVITGWVVAYEFSNLVELGGNEGTVVGFQNDYVVSDGSPNLHVGLTSWAHDILSNELLGTYDSDD